MLVPGSLCRGIERIKLTQINKVCSSTRTSPTRVPVSLALAQWLPHRFLHLGANKRFGKSEIDTGTYTPSY